MVVVVAAPACACACILTPCLPVCLPWRQPPCLHVNAPVDLCAARRPACAQNPTLLDSVISGATSAQLLVCMGPDDMDLRAKQEREAVRKNSVKNAMLPESPLVPSSSTAAVGAGAGPGAAAVTISRARVPSTSLIDSSDDDDDDDDDDDNNGGGGAGSTGEDAFAKQAASAPRRPAGAGGPTSPRKEKTAASELLEFVDPSQNGALRPNALDRFGRYLASSVNNTRQQYVTVQSLTRPSRQHVFVCLFAAGAPARLSIPGGRVRRAHKRFERRRLCLTVAARACVRACAAGICVCCA